ncbi:uncharacterized protein LOC124341928 [Daphnia pulicaria]|uniref:uncharacterized protein LOC124341928 n=1 Tax=Daphnia pulicaria TaxID=35523 RepID=UPI001EEC0CC3|nr:uncharacterized protein LOC124341928 [Daphnia pulicaria]
MSVRYQKPVVNSFHDLAAIPSYQATILTGSIQDMDLLETNLEYMKVIYEKIKKCSSDCRKFTFQEMVNPVVQKDNYVSIIPWRVGNSYLEKYNAKKCQLAMAYERTSWKPMFFAVPKSSPYIEEINREAMWFIDVGLNMYNKTPKKLCQLNYNSNGVSSKTFSSRMILEQFYLPFLILFGGYFLAFIQFCREKLYPIR